MLLEFSPLGQPFVSNPVARARYSIEHMFDREFYLSALPSSVAAACHQADWEVVRSISWAGTRFDAVVVPHWDEVDRRASAGLGAVTDYLTLRALSTLPVGVEIPWPAMDPIVAGFLAGDECGLVSRSTRGITSQLATPLSQVVVVKVARHWRAISSVGVFASDVPATVILKHLPRQLEEIVTYSERRGTGLGYLRGSEIVTLVSPTGLPRPGLRRTRLFEVIYRNWLDQAAGTPANRNQALSCFDGGSSSPLGRSSNSASRS